MSVEDPCLKVVIIACSTVFCVTFAAVSLGFHLYDARVRSDVKRLEDRVSREFLFLVRQLAALRTDLDLNYVRRSDNDDNDPNDSE